MNKYCIEILASAPPRVYIGDNVAGGKVVAIKSDDPELVSTTWLSEKFGLSKSLIVRKLRPISQGNGKFLYPRDAAVQMLEDDKVKRGRPRKN